MKNILVGGVAKSGKSTFCERLTNYNHIPLDYFTASMKRNFPEWGVSSSVIIGDTSSKLSLLLSTVTSIIDDTNEKFIIDSAHIMPRDIIKYIDSDKWDIYFFGYPNISKEEKFNYIREIEGNRGWTGKRNDIELLDTLDKLIAISRQIQEECKLYNIKVIDTSYNFNDVIDKEVNKIIDKDKEK